MTDIARLGMAFDPRYVTVKVKRLHPDAVVPQYQTDGAAGFDLHAVEDVIIGPGVTTRVRTGLAFEIPRGYALFIVPRSGVSLRTCLRIANAPGTVDADYRGEVSVIVDNTAYHPGPTYKIRAGDRIAQGIIQAVPRAEFEVVDALSETERGDGGFGSTGTGVGAE